MNAAEHYREAERLAEAARADMREVDSELVKAYTLTVDGARIAMDAAQVHATLALVGATICDCARSSLIADALFDAAVGRPTIEAAP